MIDNNDIVVNQTAGTPKKVAVNTAAGGTAKVVGFMNYECQIAYLEGRVGGRACEIIDLVLETQVATQSLVANGQLVHDNLIAIQRLARDLLTPTGMADGGEVSHGTA